MNVAIFACGPSMTREIADKVKAAGIYSIAINNSWKLAPEADVLLAADGLWWIKYPEAQSFRGEKIHMDEKYKGMDIGACFVKPKSIGTGSNSALQAVGFAADRGATKVLLFGVDLRDDELTHNDGLHRDLPNPTVDTFKRCRKAWAKFARTTQTKVINCNPRSGLGCFPKLSVDECI